ncbi:hypothetical protein [Streptomyces oceani]|uniref:hypothetical protein n=1 Tax=Streptomyces oceani TaxID=1075402 RepID=UPI00087320E0
MGTAVAIMEGYRDADRSRGVGLADAMNVALAATYRTNRVLSSDGHFRIMRPLTGHATFELLPEDL